MYANMYKYAYIYTYICTFMHVYKTLKTQIKAVVYILKKNFKDADQGCGIHIYV